MWERNDVEDDDLLAAARAGDLGAMDELFRRHHAAAVRFAEGLSGPDGADDRAAEGFARVYRNLLRGEGPDSNFKGYLLRAVNSAHVDAVRKSGAELAFEGTGEDAASDSDVEDEVLASLEGDPVRRAFGQLSPAWRTVLWYAVVIGESYEQVAERLGSNANAVGVMSHRAREGLRQAYLAEHLQNATDPECRTVTALLPRYVRGHLSPRASRVVRAHLDHCLHCQAAVADLTRINRNLGSVLTPVLVVTLPPTAAAARELAAVKSGATAAKAVGTALAATGAAVVTAVLVAGAQPGDVPATTPPQVTPVPSATPPVVVPARTLRPSPSAVPPPPTTDRVPPTTPAAPTPQVTDVASPPETVVEPTPPPPPTLSPARVVVGGSDQARYATVLVTVRPAGAGSLELALAGVSQVDVVSDGVACPSVTPTGGEASLRCTVTDPRVESFELAVHVGFVDPSEAVHGSVQVAAPGGRDAVTFTAAP